MDRPTTTPTRRAILGAALVVPAIAAIGGSLAEAASGTTLAEALFRQRHEAFNAANADFLRIADGSGRYPDEVADKYCAVASDAYHALITTPAPTERAIVEKLAALLAWSSGSQIEEDEIRTILADAPRILAAREA